MKTQNNRTATVMALAAIVISLLALLDSWILGPSGIKTTRDRFIELFTK